MSVEQASILDHLGFLFSFCWDISGKQTLPLSIDITGDWSRLIPEANPFQSGLYWYTYQQQGWMNQAYSRLSTTHGHITDCKL